jgi:hypothetical protein
MNRRFKTFLTAFGGLFIICPSANYAQLLTANTVEKRSKATWERVGRHLHSAMNTYEQETKTSRSH